MKTLLLIILAFGLSSSAFAEEALEIKQFTRVVASTGAAYISNP